ncbi:MAG: hypothetical protein RLZZ353_160 [Actinomycetota bacterium]
MGPRELDVLLLGATGFTGALTAAELATRTAGTRLRWGVAGRDRGRLERLAAELPGSPEVVVADVADPDTLAAAAARTRVLATTVGPYAALGAPVARACAEAGTHYADITGEPAFVTALEREVDAVARASGATMVVCCGFDSVPHDLGAQLAVSRLDDEAAVAVRGYVRARGRPSGGTARTALAALGERPDADAAGGATRARPGGARPAHRLDLGAHRPARLGGWAVPLPTIDPLIVLRSARVLPGYGASFAYGHYAHVRRTTTLVGAGLGLGAAALAARTGPGRSLLERVLPEPGEGPDAAARAAGSFTVLLLGSARATPEDAAAAARRGAVEDVDVVVRVRGGDPGYGETARMLAEAALTLASDERPDVAGVVTPAVGLGAPYRRRLEGSGMSFEVLGTPPD